MLKSLKLLTSSLASNQLEFHCCLSPALLSKFGHDNLCWKELWCFCQNCLIGLKRVNFFNSFLNLTHSIRQWRSHLLTFVMWASWKKLTQSYNLPYWTIRYTVFWSKLGTAKYSNLFQDSVGHYSKLGGNHWLVRRFINDLFRCFIGALFKDFKYSAQGFLH